MRNKSPPCQRAFVLRVSIQSYDRSNIGRSKVRVAREFGHTRYMELGLDGCRVVRQIVSSAHAAYCDVNLTPALGALLAPSIAIPRGTVPRAPASNASTGQNSSCSNPIFRPEMSVFPFAARLARLPNRKGAQRRKSPSWTFLSSSTYHPSGDTPISHR